MHTLTVPTTDSDGYSNWVRLGTQPIPLLTLFTPAALEATSARVVFEGSPDEGATVYAIRDDAGARYGATVQTDTSPQDGDSITLAPQKFQANTWVRLQVATSSDAGVQQSTLARVFKLAEQPL